ncbi:MAG: hypothetical protein LBI02_00290 [Opitutaceae bacterium]|jgi:hypothetical protein|nr:hypothetical protein [Opitutaceae bacterium]
MKPSCLPPLAFLTLAFPALAFPALALLVLAGCASASKSLSRHDFGPPPEKARERARSFAISTLNTPESAIVEFGDLAKAVMEAGRYRGEKTYYGWVQSLSIAVKNEHGERAAPKRWHIMFFEDGTLGNVTDMVASGMVKKIAVPAARPG